jgi:hypothetical protein
LIVEVQRDAALERQGPPSDQEWLARIEQLHPGATEIVLRDFIEERQHQREMQRLAIELDATVIRDLSRHQTRRLWMASALGFFLVASGLAMILLDKAIYGFVLLVAEISTLIAVFLTRRAGAKNKGSEN